MIKSAAKEQGDWLEFVKLNLRRKEKHEKTNLKQIYRFLSYPSISNGQVGQNRSEDQKTC